MTNPTRRRAAIVCVHAGALLCVRLRDPVSQVTRCFVPGGGIEPGESALAAAERETREETGFTVCGDATSERVARYPFVWAGVEVDCTTHFFRARLAPGVDAHAPAAVADADYNLGALWLPLADLDGAIGFHAEIHAAVRALALG
jgi:8-oxo-dGTP pyrophosphatase MutT (NUDIX family)